jgi:hypothetical protein
MQHYRKLNLSVPFLRKDFDITSITKTSKVNPGEILSCELIELANANEIYITNCIVLFYKASNVPSIIHIDDHNEFDQANLNLVIGGASSKVFWYNCLDGYEGDIKQSPFAIKRDYDFSKLTIAEEAAISGTCLFQGGVPHNVINPIEDRWCISVKLRTVNKECITWQSALEIFNSYIL